MTPRARASLVRIVRLERNHNNFVLDALQRWHLIERREGFALPTVLGTYTVHYLEDREGERS